MINYIRNVISYTIDIGVIVSNIVQLAGRNSHIERELCEWATAKTKHRIDNWILVACDSAY